MTENTTTGEIATPGARRRYQKPSLDLFGSVRELTANGSGTRSETDTSCDKKRIRTGGCTADPIT